MQALILLSASNKDSKTKNDILNFIKMGDIRIHRWLAKGEYGQWAIECCPNNSNNDFTLLRKNAEQFKLDVNFVIDDNRRKKMLLADMDSTLIKGESLDEIADKIGIGKEVAKLTSQTMQGNINFKQSIVQRVSLLKGMKTSILEEVVKETELNKGASLLAPTMKKNGAVCYILSGGFDFITSQIAKKIGFDGFFSNSLEIRDFKLTGNIIPPIFGMDAKLETLINLTNEHEISVNDVVAIGDGANDLEMLRTAGLGVAFNGKPILRKNINTQLNHTNLVGLLFLQGYETNEIYEG